MKYQVTSPVAPDPSLIGPQSAPTMRSWDFVNAMFAGQATRTATQPSPPLDFTCNLAGVKYEQVG